MFQFQQRFLTDCSKKLDRLASTLFIQNVLAFWNSHYQNDYWNWDLDNRKLHVLWFVLILCHLCLWNDLQFPRYRLKHKGLLPSTVFGLRDRFFRSCLSPFELQHIFQHKTRFQGSTIDLMDTEYLFGFFHFCCIPTNTSRFQDKGVLHCRMHLQVADYNLRSNDLFHGSKFAPPDKTEPHPNWIGLHPEHGRWFRILLLRNPELRNKKMEIVKFIKNLGEILVTIAKSIWKRMSPTGTPWRPKLGKGTQLCQINFDC